MKYLRLVALALLLLPFAVKAQDLAPMPNPITSFVMQQVKRGGELQVSAAEAMPADKYNYKPTPEVRTYGQLVLHIAQFNNMMCSKLTGEPTPSTEGLRESDRKEALVAAVKKSFDFCAMVINELDDTTLGQPVGKMGSVTLSRGGALLLLVEDWFDHFSTQALYLRMNGIRPPPTGHM